MALRTTIVCPSLVSNFHRATLELMADISSLVHTGLSTSDYEEVIPVIV